MVDISTVGMFGRVSVPKQGGVAKISPRAFRRRTISFGTIGTLLVVEQSSLEKTAPRVCDVHRPSYTVRNRSPLQCTWQRFSPCWEPSATIRKTEIRGGTRLKTESRGKKRFGSAKKFTHRTDDLYDLYDLYDLFPLDDLDLSSRADKFLVCMI